MIERSFIYISTSISGHNFDVYGYAKSVGAEAGAVVTLRHVGPPLEDDSPTYWRGKKIPSSRISLAEDLEALLKVTKGSNPSEWGGEVSVLILDKAVSNNDRGGYYLTPSVIRLLADLGCELSVDVCSGDLV